MSAIFLIRSSLPTTTTTTTTTVLRPFVWDYPSELSTKIESVSIDAYVTVKISPSLKLILPSVA